MRLAVVASHPVQYYAPLFRELARRVELTAFYAHDASAQDQAKAGFGVGFSWDVDLLSGYKHEFLKNEAKKPGLDRFNGVDTPGVGNALREGRFDALLLMGWHLKCFMQALLTAKRIGLPVMVRGDSHLDTPRSALKVAAKRAIYPHFLRLFDAALVVGKRNRTYWEHYGYPRERMSDAPHCVDNAFFAERATPQARAELRTWLGITPETKVVLFAGKLVPFKRPLDLVEAVTSARMQGVQTEIMVAGDGPLASEIRACASARDLRLHMLGFCNQSKMPAAYAAADLLVLPSNGRETWGLVVNESLASGTPALVSDAVGCAPDLTELLGESAVFRLGAIEDLAQKLRRALNSPPPPTAIARAIAHFDLGATAERIAGAANKLGTRRGGIR
jgi:glycosyltransferase involved in cell wall biosynthesis